MKLYVAGPMSGKKDLNFPLFHATAAKLRAQGHEVVNPAEINPDPAAKWEDCMREDIKQLIDCEGIVLLPGWLHSRGATLEARIAKALGLQIVRCPE